MDSAWPQEKVLTLIKLYKETPCLWDPNSDYYKIITKKTKAWNEMGKKMNCDALELRRKISSLLSSLRRERHRENEFKTESNQPYQSTWLYFKDMAFLLDKFKQRDVEYQNSYVDEVDITYEDINDTSKPEIIEILPVEHRQIEDIPPPKKRRKNKEIDNRLLITEPKIDEDYTAPPLVETITAAPVTTKTGKKSSSEIFGDYVGSKLDEYSTHTKNVVEHLISNILFKADMGKYEVHAYSNLCVETEIKEEPCIQSEILHTNSLYSQGISNTTDHFTPIYN